MNFKDFYSPNHTTVSSTVGTTISFEIFPPKTDEGVVQLFQALNDLKKFNPAFISVTYGAMGSTQALTKDLVIKIKNELGLVPAFHFTCVGGTKESIKEYVESLKQLGINLVVALRGDPPLGKADFVVPQNGFRFANELVTYLKSLDGLSMAVAGYPEKHIEAPSLEVDLQNLKRKVQSGADVIITQLFFDNADYFSYVDKVRALGLDTPIVAGIMPILSEKQIQKIASMIGAKIPQALKDKLLKYENDAEAQKEIGVEHALRQCEELVRQKVPGIHFYILNKSGSTKKILENLKL